MHELSIKQLAKKLHNRELSSLELTQYFLNRIDKHKQLNSFISVDEELALQQAKTADERLKSGDSNYLTGIPLAHKDIFCTKGTQTSCASQMLKDYRSPFSATIVEKLEVQGSVLLGKTNMDEFAMGSSNENSYFGAVRNPWNQRCVAGGSSGGSAAAVAASLAVYTTGTDTGGSIRLPASYCGVTGLKPTYGLASRYGMVAFASSLDQAGPMAKSVEDIAYVLQAMTGHDAKDSTSLKRKVPDYVSVLDNSVKSMKIGLPNCFFQANVNKEIQAHVKTAVALLEKEGAEIIEIDLDLQNLWVPCYYVIACAEASSNLSRYDGVRFGYRSKHYQDLKSLIKNSRTEAFGKEVKRRILTGTHVLSAGYYDAYYIQALKIRRLIQNELLERFKEVDIIIGPTAPNTANIIGEATDPIQNYLSDTFTVAANLAGLPALSIPVGFSEGLPVGMQLMGTHFAEAFLLKTAQRYQQLTDWHLKHPIEEA